MPIMSWSPQIGKPVVWRSASQHLRSYVRRGAVFSFIGLSSRARSGKPVFRQEGFVFPAADHCPVRFPTIPGSQGYVQLPLDVFLNEDFIRLAFGDASRVPARRDSPSFVLTGCDLHNVWWAFADHIVGEKIFWRTVREPFQKQLDRNTRFILNSFADKSRSARNFQKELSRYRWRWTDGSSIAFGDGGEVWREGVHVTDYEIISSERREIVVVWSHGIFLDRLTVETDWSGMTAVNNYGRRFAIGRMTAP